MRKILAVPFSLIFYLLMVFWLCLFHMLQVIAYHLLGYTAHKKVVETLNIMLLISQFALLNRFKFIGFHHIPKNQPLIIVSNHQSMFDIPPVVWGFRKQHPKFVAKKELGKSIPSITYNLKKGGSVLIDRKSGTQSVKELLKLGKKMEARNWSVCIFPEGTRTRDGAMRKWYSAGLKTMLKAAPNAEIVPFVIHDNYKLHRWTHFPLNIGKTLRYEVLSPVPRQGKTADELIEEVHERILEGLNKS